MVGDDEEWMNACRAELVKLQSGDPENTELWRSFVALDKASALDDTWFSGQEKIRAGKSPKEQGKRAAL